MRTTYTKSDMLVIGFGVMFVSGSGNSVVILSEVYIALHAKGRTDTFVIILCVEIELFNRK